MKWYPSIFDLQWDFLCTCSCIPHSLTSRVRNMWPFFSSAQGPVTFIILCLWSFCYYGVSVHRREIVQDPSISGLTGTFQDLANDNSLIWWIRELFDLILTNYFQLSSVQFSRSVVSDYSRPHGLQHAELPSTSTTLELIQSHVHWVGDAIQLSHPPSSPSLPTFNHSQHQGLFKWVSSSHQVAKVLEFQL